VSALNNVQADALLAVADAINDYASGIYADPYGGDQRQYERELHSQEQFYALAEHLKETARESIEHFGDDSDS